MPPLDIKDYFLPYQKAWIADSAQVKLYEKSRRTGITFATSYRAHRKCMKNSPGFTQWVTSRDEMTAKEFVTDYIAKWAKAANIVCGLDGNNLQVVDEKHGIRAFVVEYKNGNRIVSLSSNPHAFAGKGGDILIDEMDLHNDQETLLAMAVPCIQWGGQLEIVSAYDAEGSEQSVFSQLVNECKNLGNPRGWSFHSTNIYDAIADGIVEKINEVSKNQTTREEFLEQLKKNCPTIGAFNSQYACIPNNVSGNAAIRAEDLGAAKSDYEILRLNIVGDGQVNDKIDPSVQDLIERNIWEELGIKNTRVSLGYDVGRRSDLSSIWIASPSQSQFGSYKLIALITFQKCKFNSQEQFIRQGLENCNNLVAAGDETGLGMHVCENLQTDFPDRFLCVNFASKKSYLATLLISTYEERNQILPREPKEIAADLSCIRTETSFSGKIVYTAIKNPYNKDSHCDIAWSNALAIYADKEKEVEIADGMRVQMGKDIWTSETSYSNYPDNSDDYKKETNKYALY